MTYIAFWIHSFFVIFSSLIGWWSWMSSRCDLNLPFGSHPTWNNRRYGWRSAASTKPHAGPAILPQHATTWVLNVREWMGMGEWSHPEVFPQSSHQSLLTSKSCNKNHLLVKRHSIVISGIFMVHPMTFCRCKLLVDWRVAAMTQAHGDLRLWGTLFWIVWGSIYMYVWVSIVMGVPPK